MNIVQQILYINNTYKILCVEQEFIIHPAVFSLVPLSAASLQCAFTANFQIKDYRLNLDKLMLGSGDFMNYVEKAEINEPSSACQNISISYNGAVLVGSDLVKEYYMKGKLTCFSYRSVFELIFEDGVLITTIDHSKAMSRIRKNIELGLRSIYNNRDARCIKHFISSSFVGDYKSFKFEHSRLNYIKEMKKDYLAVDINKQNNQIV